MSAHWVDDPKSHKSVVGKTPSELFAAAVICFPYETRYGHWWSALVCFLLVSIPLVFVHQVSLVWRWLCWLDVNSNFLAAVEIISRITVVYLLYFLHQKSFLFHPPFFPSAILCNLPQVTSPLLCSYPVPGQWSFVCVVVIWSTRVGGIRISKLFLGRHISYH